MQRSINTSMPVVTIDGSGVDDTTEGSNPRRAVRVSVSGTSLGGHSAGVHSVGSVAELLAHEGCSRGSSDAGASSVHRVPSLGLLLGGASLAGSDIIAVSAGELGHTPLGLASSATLTCFAPLCSPIKAGPPKATPHGTQTTTAPAGQDIATGVERASKPPLLPARESGEHRQRYGIAEIVPGVLYLCAAQALLTPTATAPHAEEGQAAETPSDHAGPAPAVALQWPHGISALLCAADEVDEHRIAALRGCGGRVGDDTSLATGHFFAGFASTLRCEPDGAALLSPSPRGGVTNPATNDTSKDSGSRACSRSQLSANTAGSGEYSDLPSMSTGLVDNGSFAGCTSNGARCGPTSPSATYYRSALSEGGDGGSSSGGGVAVAAARAPSALPLHSLLPLPPAAFEPSTAGMDGRDPEGRSDANISVADAQGSPDALLHHKTLRLLHLPLRDATDSALLAYLEEACWFIDLCRAEGRRVVVFCREGRSRSSSVVIAYLMRTMGLSFEAALAHVRRRRPAVDPNIAFCAQLQKWGCQEKEAERRRPLPVPVISMSVDGCLTAAILQHAMRPLPLLLAAAGQSGTPATRKSPPRAAATSDRRDASSLSGSASVET